MPSSRLMWFAYSIKIRAECRFLPHVSPMNGSMVVSIYWLRGSRGIAFIPDAERVFTLSPHSFIAAENWASHLSTAWSIVSPSMLRAASLPIILPSLGRSSSLPPSCSNMAHGHSCPEMSAFTWFLNALLGFRFTSDADPFDALTQRPPSAAPSVHLTACCLVALIPLQFRGLGQRRGRY